MLELPFSSVTHAAIGQLPGVHAVFGHQFFPQRELVGRAPIQIKNLGARANVSFRRAMAIQTPFHIKRVGFPRQRHLIHLPMARRAANAVVHVHAVVKKDKIGRLIDTVPHQRAVVDEAIAYRREHGCGLPYLRMTRHARFSWRHAGESGLFDTCVAVAAIQTQPKNVMLMAERNRLIERHHFESRPR